MQVKRRDWLDITGQSWCANSSVIATANWLASATLVSACEAQRRSPLPMRASSDVHSGHILVCMNLVRNPAAVEIATLVRIIVLACAAAVDDTSPRPQAFRIQAVEATLVWPWRCM
jgi:hypothetical protein